MTETGPYAMNPPFGEKRVGSVGVPPIGVALRLVNVNENDVPPGEIGQVIVRTPDTMVGLLERHAGHIRGVARWMDADGRPGARRR